MITSREGLVVAHGLKKLWEEEYFDISRINTLCKILNLKPQKKIYDMLHALHCVHYSDMSTELLEEVQSMVRELFDIDRIIDPDIAVTEGMVLSENFRELLGLDAPGPNIPPEA